MTVGLDDANVAHLLQGAAADRGDLPAIIQHDGRVIWTFSGLADAASRLGTGLREQGIGPGDRVLALVREPRSLFALAAGALWAGCALVIPPRAGGIRRTLKLAAATKPGVVAADPVTWCLAAAEPALLRARLRLVTGRWEVPGTKTIAKLLAARPSLPVPTSADCPGVISYTTGTTREPKEVVRTHRVLQAQHEALMLLRSPRPEDIDLVGLPLLVLDNLAGGVPSVLPPPGAPSAAGYGRRLEQAAQRGGATTAAGFPSLFEALIRDGKTQGLEKWRAMHIGGARVRVQLVEALAGACPSAEVVVVYGSTEAEPIAAIAGREYRAMAGRMAAGEGICVGRPVMGGEVRIEAAPELTERAAWAQAGRGVGSVMVRGAQVVAHPGTGAQEGWLDTGDVGWRDEDGRLWLMGRAANSGALLPAEVEPVVEQLPWVEEAALVGMGHDGEHRAVLAVEPRGRPNRVELLALRRDLDALAIAQGWPLASIQIVKRLPKDARSGSKVQYGQLRALLGAEL